MLDGGGERWIGEKATVSRDRSGAVARITGAIVDISDLKRTEAALGLDRKPLRAGDARHPGRPVGNRSAIKDVPWVGLRLEEMLGYNAGDLSVSRARLQELVHPDDRERCPGRLRESSSSTTPSTMWNTA